ncbi:hypothetical protein ACFOEM_13670 [Paenalcaligenes hominis]|uniref:hypothetical protein n=1 Tax=Paenalcaligenes hominis TaxID=643674 RepID=UPI0036214798
MKKKKLIFVVRQHAVSCAPQQQGWSTARPKPHGFAYSLSEKASSHLTRLIRR